MRAPLESLWEPLLEDRTSTAEEIVRAASTILRDWLMALPQGDGGRLAQLLATAMDPVVQAHGWRAPVALWMQTIDLAAGQVHTNPTPLREILIEEMGLWLGGLDRAQDLRGTSPPVAWSGEVLAPGLRLPKRAACAAALLPGMEKGETICVPAFSETVAQAIEQAVAEGLRPKLALGEGGPVLGGRQMALRLEHSGISMSLYYDAALPSHLVRCDRMWLGTEAIGAGSMLAINGTQTLMAEAHRQGVPVALLATSDKLMPQAELRLPEWAERESYLLWDAPTEGLSVQSQFYERVPLDNAQIIATELGLRTPAQFALQSLATDTFRNGNPA